MKIDKKFQDWLMERMTKRGLTQAELADMVGVSRPVINKMITNRHLPRPDVLLRIADVFDVHPQVVFSKAFGLSDASHALLAKKYDSQDSVQVKVSFDAKEDGSRIKTLYRLIDLAGGVSLKWSGGGGNVVIAAEDNDRLKIDIAKVIAAHFQEELGAYIPDGEWQLTVV